MTPPQKSIQMTPIGWVALLASVGVAIGLRVALPIWLPAQFAAEGRRDPRHMALGIPFMLVPLLFASAAIVLQLLGFPVMRVTAPSSDRAPAEHARPE